MTRSTTETDRVRERLMKFVTRPAGTTCWLWAGRLNRDGYGTFTLGEQRLGAHRVAYELLKGPVPDGLELDHRCRVRACVNPDHLEPVTHAENVLRGTSFSAVNAAAVMCIHGHPYDDANTYIRTNGHRDCRACGRERVRRYKARKKAA